MCIHTHEFRVDLQLEGEVGDTHSTSVFREGVKNTH